MLICSGGFMADKNLQWCLKQKRGIQIILPNEELVKEYIKKAKSALNMMNAALHISETDWVMTTAYYARYFALYALLMKFGIKSEIHDCTIELARLLARNRIIAEHLVEDISLAKDIRIDAQYYIIKELRQEKIKQNINAARKFVLEIEEVIELVSKEQIQIIQQKLKNL